MSLATSRRAVLTALILLSGVSIWFYLHQSTGKALGGAISVPKQLWLSYAIAAWLIIPFLLWRDTRLGADMRRLFGIFWFWMVARGVAELILIYGFGHWTPWYGIAHDVSCFLLVGLMAFRLHPATSADRAAAAYAGTLCVGLMVETAFAFMFLQTKAHEETVYFASAEASWGFINAVTLAALLFFYPDFILRMRSLYRHSGVAERPPWARHLRSAAAGLMLLVVGTGAGFWTWMMRLEARAKEYQEIGFTITESCMQFRDDFMSGNMAGISDFLAGGTVRWGRDRVETPHAFTLEKWHDRGEVRELQEAVRAWLEELGRPEQAAFKIHLIDSIDSEGVTARIRFEVSADRRMDYGILRCRFVRDEVRHWHIVEAELVEGTTVTGPADFFRDRAGERGLDFVMEQDLRFVPHEACTGHSCRHPGELRFQTMRHAYAGAATADIDGDGHDDVFLAAGGRSELFRNRGDGSFERFTERAGLGEIWHVNTAGFADLDNDGDQDLFLGAFFGPSRLFENLGDGTFREVTELSGLGQDDMVTCFSYFDYDGDGDLDLYLGRFLDARTEIPDSFLYARNGEPNRLYRNEGGLRFTDVTEAAGVGDRGLTLALAAADFDRDGDQDLYVANDFGRNVLYENDGNGRFVDAALDRGALAIGGSMSASWGDYNNDGRLDLYVAALRSNQRWFVQPITARRMIFKFIREGKFGPDNPVFSDLKKYMGDDWMEIGNHALAGNSLLRQNSDGTFTDVAENAGVRPAGWYWGSGFFDFDLDGDLDILSTNGWISGKNDHDL